MKPILLGGFFLFIAYLFYPVAQQSLYYWEGDTKHYFEIDTSIMLIEFKVDPSMEKKLMESYPEAETYRNKNDSTVQLITRSISKTMKKLSEQNIIEQYPAIRVKGVNGISFITDEISIKFKNPKSESDLRTFADRLGLIYLTSTNYGAHLFQTPDKLKTIDIANALQENEGVAWSNPNFVHLISLFNDPLYPDQYYLNNTGQGGGMANIDINAPEAWEITTGSDAIRIAVVDDGVENHEDFDSRVLPGFTAGVNDTGGIPLNHSSKGHGVACAGIISATHNNIGVKGVAPNSQIVPINIFPNVPSINNPNGAATNVEIATAINWAWSPQYGNAHILSNSWGGGSPNIDITSEITMARTQGRDNLGAIVIFASGNSHQVLPGVNYPATVNGVVTVGAIDRNGNIWNYSSRGPEMDLVAPSGDVNLNGDVRTTDRMGTNGYETGNYTTRFGGTSAAAPQVTGVAALMISVNPGLTETEVRTILQNTATDMGPAGFDNTFGYGRLDAYAAVQAAFPFISGPPDPVCPTSLYSIPNLPTGTTVAWSASPAGMVSLSPSGNTVTVSRLSGQNGFVNLTAEIIFPNYGSVTSEKRIIAGISPALIDSIRGPFDFPANTSNNFSVDIIPTITNYHWSVFPSGDEWIGNQGTNGINLSISSPGFYSLGVDITNPCGTAGLERPIYVSGPFEQFNIYPNPASDNLTIENTKGDAMQPNGEVYEVSLYDGAGRELMSFPKTNQKSININVRELKNGFYYIHIRYKDALIRRQIRVER